MTGIHENFILVDSGYMYRTFEGGFLSVSITQSYLEKRQRAVYLMYTNT